MSLNGKTAFPIPILDVVDVGLSADSSCNGGH